MEILLKRHAEISLRATRNFGMQRTLATRPTIESSYQRLLDTLNNNGTGSLIEKPQPRKEDSSLTQSTRSWLPPKVQNICREFRRGNTKWLQYWRAHPQLETHYPQCSFSRARVAEYQMVFKRAPRHERCTKCKKPDGSIRIFTSNDFVKCF